MSIIGILVAMLFPAVSAARSSARNAECKNSLRQFGIGLHAYAERNRGQFCSGAWDWMHEGCVTTNGWVADLVNQGTPVGDMLCPTNAAKGSAVLEQLLTLKPADFHLGSDTFHPNCEEYDGLGPGMTTNTAGEQIINPCRRILENKLSEASVAEQVRVDVVQPFYNTNYIASWLLVRSKPRLDKSGNPQTTKTGCTLAGRKTLKARSTTAGPLTQALVDGAKTSGSRIPLLADGATAGVLSQDIGTIVAGTQLVGTFTRGPVCSDTSATGCATSTDQMLPPAFEAGHPRAGATGWWATWSKKVLQDFTTFEPVHNGVCNLLMADGSVQSIRDDNGDGYLNNGFDPSHAQGAEHASAVVEAPPEALFSKAAPTGF